MRGCLHCNFRGDLTTVAHVEVEDHPFDDEVWGDLGWQKFWQLWRCPHCERPTLQEYDWAEHRMDPADVRPRLLFPPVRDDAGIPPEVQRRLDSARRARFFDPDLYATAIGKVVEAICKQQGAKGERLSARINQLAQTKKLPEPMRELALEIAKMRNIGAHDSEIELSERDVEILEALAEALLEYLYRAPAKVRRLRDTLDERRP